MLQFHATIAMCMYEQQKQQQQQQQQQQQPQQHRYSRIAPLVPKGYIKQQVSSKRIYVHEMISPSALRWHTAVATLSD